MSRRLCDFFTTILVAGILYSGCLTPADAQWQVPDHAVPIGRGSGITGFKSAAPGAAGRVLMSNGASSDPSFVAGIPTVTIESQGGGCAIADNTAALQAAVASVVGGVRVLFPNNCTYTFTQANVLNFTKQVFLQGAAVYSTILAFNPTAAGYFLKWSNGLSEIFAGGGAGLDNLTLASADTTYTKIMVWMIDLSGFRFTNSSIGWPLGSPVTGGIGSVCLYTQGREASVFDNLSLECDRPLQIGMNPHFYGSVDHFHFSNLYLLTAGAFPVITVDPGVVFSNTTFDGFQIWALGTTGFDYHDTAAVNAISSIGAAGSGYVAGTPITLTGGTCSTAITILPLTVNGSGGVTSASVSNPGVCTVTPSNPVSAASGGATFNLYLIGGVNLSIANVRSEQGTDITKYTFDIRPKGVLQGLEIKNSYWDSGRCGVLLNNVKNATIQDNALINGSCNVAVNATSANGNDVLTYINNFWGSTITHTITGLNLVSSSDFPTGTSATVPPTATYMALVSPVAKFTNSSATGNVAATTFNNVGITSAGSTAAIAMGSGKTATFSNTMTQTATDSSTIAFGAGGTVLYSGGVAVQTVKKQAFTASGTYTPSTGMLYTVLECVGGGGGGGSAAGGAGNTFSGGGGGGGGYSRLVATAATIGASKTVTIGGGGNGGASGSNNGAAGADSCFTTTSCVSGQILAAKGGGGGQFGSVAQVPLGGLGGVAGTGDITATGNVGGGGVYFTGITGVTLISGNNGAGSYFGGGALAPTGSGGVATAGNNASANTGGGGSGANAINGAVNAAGGNGGSGLCIATDYNNQ